MSRYMLVAVARKTSISTTAQRYRTRCGSRPSRAPARTTDRGYRRCTDVSIRYPLTPLLLRVLTRPRRFTPCVQILDVFQPFTEQFIEPFPRGPLHHGT